jgi:hypothetical protein
MPSMSQLLSICETLLLNDKRFIEFLAARKSIK